MFPLCRAVEEAPWSHLSDNDSDDSVVNFSERSVVH